MSFSPYYYYLIGEGIKKIEVRKTVARDPDWNGIVECYMTKDKRSFNRIPKEIQEKYRAHMGKIGMRVVCDWTARLETVESFQGKILDSNIGKDFSETALTKEEIINYAGRRFKSKTDYWVEYLYFCYGWHITWLKFYDEPKELGEFSRLGFKRMGYSNCMCGNEVCKYREEQNTYYDPPLCMYGNGKQMNCQLTRPPQSWFYVENEKAKRLERQ